VEKDVEVTVAEIARLGGVGRAAVSNWRRRYDDFPQPVGGTSLNPVFSLHEVRRWLDAHAEGRRLPEREWLWQELRASAAADEPAELIADLGAFLVYLDRDRANWAELSAKDEANVAAELPRRVRATCADVLGDPPVPRSLAKVGVPLLRRLAGLADADGPRETFAFLRERCFELHSRRTCPTPGPIARLMAELGGLDAERVLDPACGTGALLEPFRDRPHGPPGVLLGQEVDAATARLTAVHLAFGAARVNVAAGDSLRQDAFAGVLVDTVVCYPPFNDRAWGYDELETDPRWEYGLPPRMESELAWAQHALAHLKPGGTAVLVMPPAAANRRSGRRIRTQLIRRGALRAVIALPQGAVPNMAVALALWVLRRPVDARTPEHVLMVDTATRFNDFARVAADAWMRFDRGEDADEPGVSRAVPVLDLLDEDVDLTPTRYLSPPVADLTVERVISERDAMADLLRATADLLPAVEAVRDTQGLPTVPLAELVRRKMLTIHHQSPVKLGEHSPVPGDRPVLTVEELLGEGPPGEVTSPAAVQHEIVIERGDVLVAQAAARLVVRVATESGAILGLRVTLLRTDPERLDPYFLAGFVTSSINVRHYTGTGSRLHSDIRRAEIPLPPIEEQRAYGEAFRRLADFERGLRRAARMGEDLIRLISDGLAQGIVRPVGAHTRGTPR
jgi:Type I restriction-modification system methyltransferase subunit